MNRFKVVILKEARYFIDEIDPKAGDKILSNILKIQEKNDIELFKKLNAEIWELRTLYNSIQYRLFAFWDKTDNKDTLVVATHGIIKKTNKIALREISKAEQIRNDYFNRKQNEFKNKRQR